MAAEDIFLYEIASGRNNDFWISVLTNNLQTLSAELESLQQDAHSNEERICELGHLINGCKKGITLAENARLDLDDAPTIFPSAV